MTMPRLIISNDLPYNTWQADPLGFTEKAKSLAEKIKDSRDNTPFTIGIQAPWGAGKSTFMKYIQKHLIDSDLNIGESNELLQKKTNILRKLSVLHELRQHKTNIRTVWFEAWSVEPELVLKTLVSSILHELDKDVTRRLKKILKDPIFSKLARSACKMVFGLPVFGHSLVNPELIDEIWEMMDKTPVTRQNFKDSLDKAMASWVDEGRMVVVFIDDLDRCSPETVYAVFETVKLYLDVKGLCFIIGYDYDVLTKRVLSDKGYDDSDATNGSLTRAYIDKVIQAVYTLPPSSIDQLKIMMSEIITMSLFPFLESDEELQTILIDRCDRNPRKIKQFINRFNVACVADTEHPTDQILLQLLLELCFPDFFKLASRISGATNDTDVIRIYLGYDSFINIKDEKERNENADVCFLKLQLGISKDANPTKEEIENRLPIQFPALQKDNKLAKLLLNLKTATKNGPQESPDKSYKFVSPATNLNKNTLFGSKTLENTAVLRDYRIFWIAQTEEKKNERNELEKLGCIVKVSESYEHTVIKNKIYYFMPSLIISNVRPGNQGFADIAKLHEKKVIGSRPVLFYCSYITPQREVQAIDLKKKGINVRGITDLPKKLLRLIINTASDPSCSTNNHDSLESMNHLENTSNFARRSSADVSISREYKKKPTKEITKEKLPTRAEIVQNLHESNLEDQREKRDHILNEFAPNSETASIEAKE